MKIGIISINAHTKVLNFASPLHSYAFQQFLKMHGYDSVIIDYKPNYYGQYNPRHPLFYQLSHPMKNKKKQRAALKKWLKLFIPRQPSTIHISRSQILFIFTPPMYPMIEKTRLV